MKQFSEENTAFHRQIIFLSGNRQLVAIAPPLVDLALITRTYRKFSDERIRKSSSDHADLVQAFRRRDGMWAEAIMRSHILSSVELASKD
ncbi:putative regulatory protein [Salipiger mucosus DSM 16094]|uniref:Putative regulatory protein n=1 Tax=Salipiger mucosus DSM 16094 TaxID=1123237 RepID=S9RS57_9RHOB|nr:putative regulatory protein [Salipiger mucosus DSM 16094]